MDVSDYIGEFDPRAVEVIVNAPVWMTRAERLLLFTLTFTLRPRRYLEIGTLHGGSALIVCGALDASGNTDAKIICLDPRPQVAPETLDKIHHRATVITGYSPQDLPQAQQAVGGGLFDLVLIDGDHSRNGVMRDAEGVLAHVAKGAHLLFHDCHNPEVRAGIDSFARKYARRLADAGPMTREITTADSPGGKSGPWGGIRMMEVRG